MSVVFVITAWRGESVDLSVDDGDRVRILTKSETLFRAAQNLTTQRQEGN